MCILFVAWRQDRNYPLIVAANRDEFYLRPSAPAAFWTELPHVLAGRDLSAGGTWLGVNRCGRFAALTNFREPAGPPHDVKSRGMLPLAFLTGSAKAIEYAEEIRAEYNRYAGFSLVIYDGTDLVFCSNRGTTRRLDPGIYALSNHQLDTDWPKVSRGRTRFAAAVTNGASSDELFALLRDRAPAPDEDLPNTGVGLDWERVLSPVFVTTVDYGTRCSSVVRYCMDGPVDFEERTFTNDNGLGVDPDIYSAVRYRFLPASTP